MEQVGISRVLLVLTVILAAVCHTQASDSMRCCTGYKEMQGILFCSKPCCTGFHEKVADAPFGLVIICEEEKLLMERPEPSFDLFERFGRRRRRSLN